MLKKTEEVDRFEVILVNDVSLGKETLKYVVVDTISVQSDKLDAASVIDLEGIASSEINQSRFNSNAPYDLQNDELIWSETTRRYSFGMGIPYFWYDFEREGMKRTYYFHEGRKFGGIGTPKTLLPHGEFVFRKFRGEIIILDLEEQKYGKIANGDAPFVVFEKDE